jgi:hypothetical protein
MSTLSLRASFPPYFLCRTNWLAVFALIFLASCHGDENLNPLVGTWTLQTITALNCKDTSQDLTVTFACENSACKKYTFSADGTLKIEEFSKDGIIVAEGTYTNSNGTLVTHISDGQNPSMRTFNVNIREPNYLYLVEIFSPGSGKCSATTILTK